MKSELGSGHARAAHAVEFALRRQRPDAEVRVFDWWALMDRRVAQAARQMYLELIQRHPELYERVYRLGDGTWRDMLAGPRELPPVVRELFAVMHTLPIVAEDLPSEHATDRLLFEAFRTPQLARADSSKLLLIKWAWGRLKRRLRSELVEFDPDVVVSTQMIPAALVSAIKCSTSSKRTMPFSVAVATDFGVHDFWRQAGTDLYCIPHQALTEMPTSLEVERVAATGFPLMPEFANPPTVAEARKALQLDPDRPVILVLGGGLGLGVESVTHIALRTSADAQILVLRGKCAGLPKPEPRCSDRIREFDWTERVDLFMAASDLVVGKCGGSTVAETLACGRPLLATRSLPGQEGFNLRFLEKHGVGRLLEESELAPEIDRLLANPLELAQLKHRAAALGRRDGAEAIASKVLALSAQRGRSLQGAHIQSRRELGRKILTRVDTWYGRRFRLRPLGPVLLVGREPYRGLPREFPDGTRLAGSDTVGVLHLNNLRLAALSYGSRQSLGVKFARLFRESLQALARHAQIDPELSTVAVFHGVTWFKAHGSKVGFVSEALPRGPRRWWLSGHFRLLTWGFASLPAPTAGRLEPRRFWITRGDLIKHFGAKPK